MTRQAAAVAAGPGSGTGKPQCRAISLNVAVTLTVIALLAFGRSRLRANIGFVTLISCTLGIDILGGGVWCGYDRYPVVRREVHTRLLACIHASSRQLLFF